VLTARWVVDASGRAGLLKRHLRLSKGNRHRVNAAWFRVDRVVDIDEWHADSAWRGRVEAPRHLSTNHLMGPGYCDHPVCQRRIAPRHRGRRGAPPFDTIRTAERVIARLERHEPDCRGGPRRSTHGFLVMRDYRTLAVVSTTRRAVGDHWRGRYFADPLYSPGSDFIDEQRAHHRLILRDVGEPIERGVAARAHLRERVPRGSLDSRAPIPDRRRPRAMT
jgi:hypothetical protein